EPVRGRAVRNLRDTADDPGGVVGLPAALLRIPAAHLRRLSPLCHVCAWQCADDLLCQSLSRSPDPVPEVKAPMSPQKIMIWVMTVIGGAVGLFAPVVVVKWLLQTEPEDAGILTFFFLPVWILLVVIGLLVGRRLGVALVGVRRAAQRYAFT